MRPRLQVLALVLGLSALTACGGEDGLSKEEFIAQGDAVCEQLDKDTEAVPAPTGQDGIEEYVDTLTGLVESAKSDFAALEAPSDGTDLQTDVVGALDTAIDILEGAAAAAASGDLDAAAESVPEGAAEESEAVSKKAAEYGFASCGAEL